MNRAAASISDSPVRGIYGGREFTRSTTARERLSLSRPLDLGEGDRVQESDRSRRPVREADPERTRTTGHRRSRAVQESTETINRLSETLRDPRPKER